MWRLMIEIAGGGGFQGSTVWLDVETEKEARLQRAEVLDNGWIEYREEDDREIVWPAGAISRIDMFRIREAEDEVAPASEA
jgi:hypothetical protein